MLKYRIDVLAALKNTGYTSYKIRKDKLIGEARTYKNQKRGNSQQRNIEYNM